MLNWSFAASCLSVFYGLLQINITSGYISREDFGAYSIILIVVGFGLVLSDVGVASGFMQKEKINEFDVGSAFFVAIAQSCIVFLIICALIPLICKFYENDELKNQHVILFVIFLCNPIVSVGLCCEQKKYNIKLISILEIISSTSAFCVFFILVKNNFGINSLLWGAFFPVFLKGLFYLFLLTKNWGKGFFYKVQISQLSYYWKIGFYQVISESINYFNVQIDSIIFGKIFGVADLGTYNAAKQLAFRPAGFINPMILRILMPVLSGAKVVGKNSISIIYRNTINGIIVVHCAIFFALSIFGKEVCKLLLNNRWGDVEFYFSVMCLYVMQRAIGSPVGVLMSVCGENKKIAIWNMCMFLYIPIIIVISFYFGRRFVPVFLVIGFLFAHIPAWYFMVRCAIGTSFSEYFYPQFKILLMALFLFLPVYLHEGFYLKILHYFTAISVFIFLNRKKIICLKSILGGSYRA